MSLVVPHQTDRAVLGQHDDPLRLPTFQIRGEEPSTRELVAGTTATLGGVAATPLRVSWPGGDAQPDASDLILIETEPLDGPPPAPFAWRPHSDDVVASLRPAAVANAMRQWLDEQRHGYLPSRPQWSRPGWLAEASAWLTAEVGRIGATLTAPAEIVQLWDASVVVRATTDAGRLYLKCSAEIFRSEAVVTAALAARSPDLLPEVVAIDEQRGWLLLADFGDRTLGDDPPDQWHRALPTHAALQQDWLGRAAELIELGARNRPMTEVADRVAATGDDDVLMAKLEPEVRERWLAATPTLADQCRRLAAIGPGAALVHGDLHPWNVTADHAGMRFFDWTDAAVSHPFVDLATFVPRCDDPSLRRQMWEAYIDSWRDYLTAAERDEAARLALVVGMLYQLETYRLLVPTLMPGNPIRERGRELPHSRVGLAHERARRHPVRPHQSLNVTWGLRRVVSSHRPSSRRAAAALPDRSPTLSAEGDARAVAARGALMKTRILTGMLATATVGAIAVALAVASPQAASGSDGKYGWKGQEVSSRAEALRLAHAEAPNTLVLVSTPTQVQQVDIDGQGFGTGDFLMVNLRLDDESGDHHLGRAAIRCDIGINTQTCHGTFLIFKKGQINVDGVFWLDREKVALSITGGVDRYRGAGGLMRVFSTGQQSLLVMHFTA